MLKVLFIYLSIMTAIFAKNKDSNMNTTGNLEEYTYKKLLL